MWFCQCFVASFLFGCDFAVSVCHFHPDYWSHPPQRSTSALHQIQWTWVGLCLSASPLYYPHCVSCLARLKFFFAHVTGLTPLLLCKICLVICIWTQLSLLQILWSYEHLTEAKQAVLVWIWTVYNVFVLAWVCSGPVQGLLGQHWQLSVFYQDGQLENKILLTLLFISSHVHNSKLISSQQTYVGQHVWLAGDAGVFSRSLHSSQGTRSISGASTAAASDASFLLCNCDQPEYALFLQSAAALVQLFNQLAGKDV